MPNQHTVIIHIELFVRDRINLIHSKRELWWTKKKINFRLMKTYIASNMFRLTSKAYRRNTLREKIKGNYLKTGRVLGEERISRNNKFSFWMRINCDLNITRLHYSDFCNCFRHCHRLLLPLSSSAMRNLLRCNSTKCENGNRPYWYRIRVEFNAVESKLCCRTRPRIGPLAWTSIGRGF